MTGTINIISKCINIHSVSNIERDNNDNETYTKQKNSVIAELQKINKIIPFSVDDFIHISLKQSEVILIYI